MAKHKEKTHDRKPRKKVEPSVKQEEARNRMREAANKWNSLSVSEKKKYDNKPANFYKAEGLLRK